MTEMPPTSSDGDPDPTRPGLGDDLRELLLASCSAVLVVAADGHITSVATAAGDELGLILAQQQGAMISEVLEDTQADDGRPRLAALMSGGAPPMGSRLRLRIPDRPSIWVRVAARPARGATDGVLIAIRPLDSGVAGRRPPAGGRPLASLGRPMPLPLAARDQRAMAEDEDAGALLGPAATDREVELATSLRRRLEQVHSLQRQVDDLLSARRLFLSASAHELKTPLTILQVYLETLLEDLAEGLTEEQLSFLRICHESALRLRRLVVDLVDLAALESGEIQLAFDRVELLPIINAVLEEVEPLARHAEVSLRIADRGVVPPVRTDPSRTQQVLRNLVDNAVRHTPAGGTVSVSAVCRDRAVRVTVSDTGVGIRADRLESILRPGAERTASGGSGRGSGIGLAVSQRLAMALGGRLTGESVEGKGSSFTVSLPVWR